VQGRPVFNTMKGAVQETGANASIVFVPPPFAADAIMEAADAGIKFCTCVTDGIPAQDMMRVKRFMRRYRAEDKMVGDPINGSSFKDILAMFEADPDTDAVMMIGEIGGPQEAEAAAFIRDHMKKPVIAYVAGLSAPKGRQMGHAGAIISAFGETAQAKVDILAEAGVTVAPNPSAMGETVAMVLEKHSLAA